jgi:hypothetical protein
MIARTVISIFIFVLQSKIVEAQDGVAPPKVEIPGTQLLKITSAIVGQEYDLFVHLPRFYHDTTKAFPVLYLLDAQWDFPLVTAIFGEQYYDGFIPGTIIVGITWGGENPNYDALRLRDLSPTKIQQVSQSGHAEKFLGFIKKELIPFIESRYRTTKNDRTLMGSSLGGLFTLYTLFHETELFNRYVLTSPALGWDNEVIYSHEKNFAEKKSQLPVRIFMAVGDLEDVSGFQKFVDRMKSRNYEGLALQSRVLENTGHSGTKAEGFARGLQAVFARPSLSMAPALLEKYAGVYLLNSEVEIRISRESNRLIMQGPGNTKVLFNAESEEDFYVKGQYLFVHFRKDDLGKIAGFQLERFAGEQFVRRLAD